MPLARSCMFLLLLLLLPTATSHSTHTRSARPDRGTFRSCRRRARAQPSSPVHSISPTYYSPKKTLIPSLPLPPAPTQRAHHEHSPTTAPLAKGISALHVGRRPAREQDHSPGTMGGADEVREGRGEGEGRKVRLIMCTKTKTFENLRCHSSHPTIFFLPPRSASTSSPSVSPRGPRPPPSPSSSSSSSALALSLSRSNSTSSNTSTSSSMGNSSSSSKGGTSLVAWAHSSSRSLLNHSAR